MTNHPEIRQAYLMCLSRMATRKNISYAQAQLEAYGQLWHECLDTTRQFLAAYCPALIESPFDDIERELQLQEVLDDELEAEEEA